VVKAFGGQDYESAHFGFINEKTRSLQMKMIATEAASVPLVQMISALAIAVIVYLSTMQGIKEDISVGTFMSFVVAMGLLLPPVKRLTGVNAQLQRGIIAAETRRCRRGITGPKSPRSGLRTPGPLIAGRGLGAS
jgi:subfamily B ATP-binding cassette protein MsbA